MKKFIKENHFVLIFIYKAIAIAAALFLAYLVRFDFYLRDSFWHDYPYLLVFALLVKFPIFWQQGLSRGWWRYVSIADIILLARANLLASMGFIIALVFFYDRMTGVPRSVLVLDGVFCFALMSGTRFLTRAARENYIPGFRGRRSHGTNTLIIGAGSAGQMIAREIQQNRGLNKKVVGFIDDDPMKQGYRIVGYKVLGTQEDLVEVCRREQVEEIISAIPSANGRQMRSIVERCENLQISFKTLPGVSDLIDGRVSIQQVRDVALEDLLGRDPIRLELDRIRAFVEGKRVLVTGAAGSIGSEICRQVCHFNPARIILFDNSESPLFNIHRELAGSYPNLHHTAIVGDIRDIARIEGVFDNCLPQVVFHAAAYKHVPLMEDNSAEAANNNVRGTRVVAEAANRFKAESFVMISTDKAVNPTNVMGASKRAAELVVQSLARRSSTRFVTVRFGNVLGSAGSVIPIFKEQIASGGPVTVTHPEVTRFFMTIPEATQLVLQAGSMGAGGEIYLLDMGEPVRIVTLAEQLIQLSGFIPYEDIEIEFTGLRPGEKLYEELLIDGEGVQPTSHEKIMVARATVVDRERLLVQLEELYQLQRVIDQPGVIAKLREIVPEFRPEKAGVERESGKQF
ncbi:MAG: nucleoside-diphosphate sugar epimerase/dehydratase [Desulfuromonadaceae bacterium]|nr:nucleoside-diphosphate sugar epimerase/dehydratase [Desulfuromonadaceae bacterium]